MRSSRSWLPSPRRTARSPSCSRPTSRWTPSSSDGAPRMYSFSATLAGLRREGESFVVAPGVEWLQGRTIYGGLSAALAIEAAQRLSPDLPPLRGAQIAYVGPSSGSLSIRPQMLRAGRSASFVSVAVSRDAGAAPHATLL